MEFQSKVNFKLATKTSLAELLQWHWKVWTIQKTRHAKYSKLLCKTIKIRKSNPSKRLSKTLVLIMRRQSMHHDHCHYQSLMQGISFAFFCIFIFVWLFCHACSSNYNISIYIRVCERGHVAFIAASQTR